jgi:hypothetical protein
MASSVYLIGIVVAQYGTETVYLSLGINFIGDIFNKEAELMHPCINTFILYQLVLNQIM